MPVNIEVDLSNSLSDAQCQAHCNSHPTTYTEVASNRRKLDQVVEINPTMLTNKYLKYASSSSSKATPSKLPHDNFIIDDNKMYPGEKPSEISPLNKVPVVEMKNLIADSLENTATIKESSTPVQMKEVIQANYMDEQRQPGFTATEIRQPPYLTDGYSNKLDKTTRMIQWENVQTNKVYTTVDVYKRQDSATDDDNDERTMINPNTITPTSSHYDESLTEADDIQISFGQHTPCHNKSVESITHSIQLWKKKKKKKESVVGRQHQNKNIITQRSRLHQKQSSHESKESICNEMNDKQSDSGSETFDQKPSDPHQPMKPILRSDSSVTTYIEEESTFYSTMHQKDG
uniref:Uncharacterized protein n=1 Tax=Trichobilharzia regenti TaxID=157069 RepID=A0AA85J827_TRIRE|nr:unnamed protein product [Trichobilharzia regenti]